MPFQHASKHAERSTAAHQDNTVLGIAGLDARKEQCTWSTAEVTALVAGCSLAYIHLPLFMRLFSGLMISLFSAVSIQKTDRPCSRSTCPITRDPSRLRPNYITTQYIVGFAS